jgi:hypothetical protein
MSKTAEELRAELALLEQSDSVEGEIFDGQGGIHLTIRGEDFECRKVSVSWQMMQFAKAQRAANITIPSGLPEDSPKRKELEERRSAAGMKMMSLLLDTTMILLKPHERERFEEYMDTISEDGLEQGELEQAIGAVIAAAGGEKGKAERTTVAQSSASSQTTSENVRVVSFNQDGDTGQPVELMS